MRKFLSRVLGMAALPVAFAFVALFHSSPALATPPVCQDELDAAITGNTAVLAMSGTLLTYSGSLVAAEAAVSSGQAVWEATFGEFEEELPTNLTGALLIFDDFSEQLDAWIDGAVEDYDGLAETYSGFTLDVAGAADDAILLNDAYFACIDVDCGNSSIDNYEECDDGGESSTCTASCTESACGDAYLNPTAGEQCDDGNTANGDTCDSLCRDLVCGNGIVGYGEQCDTGTGNTLTCDHNCTYPVCGDGILNTAAGEACDDGNTSNGDTCSSLCIVGNGSEGGGN